MNIYISDKNDLGSENFVNLSAYRVGLVGSYSLRNLIRSELIDSGRKNNLSAITIPYEVDENYSYDFFIRHIRTENEEILSKIPVIVYLRGDDETSDYLDNYQKMKLYNIGVVFSENPNNKDVQDAIESFDEDALEDYRVLVCSEPFSYATSHDISNKWGPYVILRSLDGLPYKKTDDFYPVLSQIENSLLEMPYFKNLVFSFDEKLSQGDKVNTIKGAVQKLKKLQIKKVLVVEDELSVGWKGAYESVFSFDQGISLVFARDEIETKEAVDKHLDFDLILLDVRLNEVDRFDQNQDESLQSVEMLTGVRLAKWIRKHERMKTVPIVAATASNKSWTLEKLIANGINAYWVKGGDFINSLALALENTSDLYQKIQQVMDWSRRTRPWQEVLYRSAEITKSHRLLTKARSLHALLFQSFSPFSNELSRGLQLNLAFLESYSCLNDLVELSCEIRNGHEWWLSGYDSNEPFIEGKKISKNKIDWYLHPKSSDCVGGVFPDSLAIEWLFRCWGLHEAAGQFDRLRRVRNNLPIIHGKLSSTGTSSEDIEPVSEKHISDLVDLISLLVDKFSTIKSENTATSASRVSS